MMTTATSVKQLPLLHIPAAFTSQPTSPTSISSPPLSENPLMEASCSPPSLVSPSAIQLRNKGQTLLSTISPDHQQIYQRRKSLSSPNLFTTRIIPTNNQHHVKAASMLTTTTSHASPSLLHLYIAIVLIVLLILLVLFYPNN